MIKFNYNNRNQIEWIYEYMWLDTIVYRSKINIH